MKRIFLLLTISYCSIAYTQTVVDDPTDSIRHRIFLVGDAGVIYGDKHPVIDWMAKNIDWDDSRNTLLYLGDNVYPEGLPPEGHPDYPYSKKVIDYQINLVKGKKSRAYFVMGNHDWRNGKPGGWQQAVNQEQYINSQLLDNVQAWPTQGCPGPIEVILDSQVVVILMDSQWFLHTHDKPGPGSGCTAKTLEEFTTELSEIVNIHKNQLLILAMHHPIYTVGSHGGAYTWRHHIFPLAEAVKGLYIPLPIIGSIYPIARGIFGNIQDVNHPVYRTMAKSIEDVLRRHPNVITAAGHDHSLQLIQRHNIPHIVSGSGAKLTRIQERNNPNVKFASVSYGFAIIEVRKSGKTATKFFNLQTNNLETPIYRQELPTIVPAPPPVLDTSKMPSLPEYVTVAADPQLEGNFLRNLFVGENYRDEWTQPVTVPVFHIESAMGGMIPERLGGGKQTKSLKLEDTTGKSWSLRSIEKFPEAAVPLDLRQTIAKDVVKQGVSASYPYASLSIGPLANAAGVPQLRRRLVYIPDDPRLKRFRADMANTLAILEEREPGELTKSDNTDEVVLKLAKDNDHHIDQRAVLKARLLDNFVMDFDRHEDQWRWATYDTGKGKMYYPIPRDHDQAFFTNQGLIPFFARRTWYLPEVQGFRAKAKDIKTFNRPARNFDRFFLTELSEDTWRRHIDTFLNQMTDSVIEYSLRQQPSEVHRYSMDEVANTLKERRQYFKNEMLEYYRFISKEVDVVGTNQREQYIVTKNADGSVHVLVNKIDKEGIISSKIYDRVFDPNITKEVRLYGLSGEDRFIIEGGDSPIKIRIIGGAHSDEFINNGNGGTVKVYDASYEQNQVLGNPGLKLKISNNPEVNRYNRLNYKYDLFMPGASIAYNIDDGLFLGAQIEWIKQGFRKEPYRMRHFISAHHALKTSSIRFRYDADYIGIFGYHDLVLRSDIRAPVNVTNFFGLGNETVFDENKPGEELFYRARYNISNASLLLRRQLQSWLRIHYGTTFQGFRVKYEENQDKFVGQTSTNSLDSSTLYKGRIYGGAHLKLDINSRNNKVLPTRGFTMDMNLRPLLGLNNYSGNLMQFDFDMRVYASIFRLPRIVLATRLGYGSNIGDYEFPQAYKLSGTENLRGYRRDRFQGRTILFNNTELRFKLADFNTYLFPGSFGIFLFNDVGRVWIKNESSKDWKVGNGGGIYLAPVNRFVITAAITRSKEEKALPLVTFGFQF